jgi:hypothetical protein
MASDDIVPDLTPEEIAERHRLVAELMRPGSATDLPQDLVARRNQELMAQLLLGSTPVASTPTMTAPTVSMSSGAMSSPSGPDSMERLLFDPMSMFPPAAWKSATRLSYPLPGAAEAVLPSPFHFPVVGGRDPSGRPLRSPNAMPHDRVRSLSGLIGVRD